MRAMTTLLEELCCSMPSRFVKVAEKLNPLLVVAAEAV